MEYGTIIASGAMGMIGTLAGALMNNFLSQSSRRTERLLDLKNNEYREMIVGINEALRIILELGGEGKALGPTEQRELQQAQTKSMVTLATSIYTSEDVIRLNVIDRWGKSLQDFNRVQDMRTLGEEGARLCQDIREAAKNAARELA